MILHYIQHTFHILRTNRIFSGLGLLNLAIGLTISLSLFYIYDYESGYDKGYRESKNLYRVLSVDSRSGKDMYSALAGVALSEHILKNVSGIEAMTLTRWMLAYRQDGGKSVRIRAVLAADTSLLHVLDQKIIAGNSKSPLVAPNSIVVSETEAIKWFGTLDNVIGQQVSIKGRKLTQDFRITAIMADAPEHNSMRPRCLINIQFYKDDMKEWTKDYNYTPSPWQETLYYYIRFIKDAPVHTFESQMDVALGKIEDNSFIPHFYLQPMRDIYLKSRPILNTLHREGDETNNLIFLITGIMILAISTINMIVLTTAQANQRISEFGLRKSQGASRKDLLVQIGTESLVMILLCGLLSIILSRLMIPTIADILEVNIPVTEFFSFQFVLRMVMLVFMIALLVGSYSAFYLSGLSTIKLQGSQRNASNASVWLYRFLVLIQMVIVIGLFQAMGAVKNQIDYMLHKDMGFDPDNVYMVDIDARLKAEHEFSVYSEVLKQNPVIEDVASFTPTLLSRSSASTSIADPKDPTKIFHLLSYHCTPNAISLLGLQMMSGFGEETADGNPLGRYLNNSAAERLFPGEDVVGKKIFSDGDGVLGTIQDFHVRSLHEVIGPFSLYTTTEPYNIRSTLIKTTGSDSSLVSINRSIEAYLKDSGRTFEITPLAEQINNLYKKDIKFREKLSYFVFLAIVIAGIGLFSTSFFVVDRRLKDFAIMKVLGASPNRIGLVMFSEFFLISAVAAVIATPLGLKIIELWLANFYYQAPISVANILISIGTAFIVMLGTVSINFFRVLRQQPIRILREE